LHGYKLAFAPRVEGGNGVVATGAGFVVCCLLRRRAPWFDERARVQAQSAHLLQESLTSLDAVLAEANLT